MPEASPLLKVQDIIVQPTSMNAISQACYDANAIPTRSRYGTYAAAIAGRYGWEGLGGQGMGCEWSYIRILKIRGNSMGYTWD